MKGKQTVLKGSLVLAALLLLIPISYGNAYSPQPVMGTAVVDCSADEWTLGDTSPDFFSNMYRAYDSGNVLESKLYVRYQCRYDTTGDPLDAVVYAFVNAEPGVQIAVSGTFGSSTVTPSMNHIKILDLGNNDIVNGDDRNPTCDPLPLFTQPQFQWIGYDDSNTNQIVATGWEASFFLMPGDYTGFLVHAQVYDGGQSQTSGVPSKTGIPLKIWCPPIPTAVTLASFKATGGPGSIALNWETASEMDNLGFNLARADSPEGPWTQLNSSLIPSLVPPGSPVGAVYTFEDTAVEPGVTYYYQLEALDIYGQSELHGPVDASLQIPRRALVRPRPHVADSGRR